MKSFYRKAGIFSALFFFFGLAAMIASGAPGVFMAAADSGTLSSKSIPAFQAAAVPQYQSILLKEELMIGSVAGAENTMFGSVISFNVDDQGNFYVMD